MSENSIEFSLSNSEQRDSWLNSSHRTLDADMSGFIEGSENLILSMGKDVRCDKNAALERKEDEGWDE